MLDSHNQFVGELVKDAIHVGRFVPVVGSVIVIVEGTVAAGKHGVYMIGLVADGDFSGAANAHTAYMLSSAVSISGNEWLAGVSGFDKLLDILDEKGNQNGRLAGAASKELAMLLLPAALARPTAVTRNAPGGVLFGEAEHIVQNRALAERVVRNLEAMYARETGLAPRLGATNSFNPQNQVITLFANESPAFRLGYRAEELHHWMQIRQLEAQTGKKLFGMTMQEIEREIPGIGQRLEAEVVERLRRSGFVPYNYRNYAPYTNVPRPPGVAGN